MTFFVLLTLTSTAVLGYLFSRHLNEIKNLEREELERKIREEPSPFYEVEEKIFEPAKIWLVHHLPFALLRASELAVKESRRVLLRLAASLGGIHDYLRGRKISLSSDRKSAYWTEIHEDVKNGRNENKKAN